MPPKVKGTEDALEKAETSDNGIKTDKGEGSYDHLDYPKPCKYEKLFPEATAQNV